jgi:hypothetical protein
MLRVIRRIVAAVIGPQQYRNKWERMTGEPCQPPARERNGRAWPTSPPPPKRQEGQQ